MNLILSTVRAFSYQTLPYLIIVLPIYIIIRLCIRISRKKKQKSNVPAVKEIGYALFTAYLVFVFSSTILPDVYINPPRFNIYYPGGGFGIQNITSEYINLIPGNIFTHMVESFFHYGGATLLISFLGNLLLLFPVGILFYLLFDNSILKNLCVGAGISLFIELYQLFLSRATDIDDLLLNVCGMLLGCLIIKLCNVIKENRAAKTG